MFGGWINDVASIITVTGVIAGVITGIVLYLRNRVNRAERDESARLSQEAIASLQGTVTALKEQNNIQAKDMENQDERINKLEGTVTTLKDIPLAKIEQHMAATNRLIEQLVPLIPTAIERTTTEKTVITPQG